MTTTFETLKHSEHDLVRALDTAADLLDGIGTTAVDAALERVAAAAVRAQARLACALQQLNDLVGGLARTIAEQVRALGDDLSATVPVSGEAAESAAPGPVDDLGVQRATCPEASCVRRAEDAQGVEGDFLDLGVEPVEEEPAPAIAACSPVLAMNDEPPAPLFSLVGDGPYSREGVTPRRGRGRKRKPR